MLDRNPFPAHMEPSSCFQVSILQKVPQEFVVALEHSAREDKFLQRNIDFRFVSHENKKQLVVSCGTYFRFRTGFIILDTACALLKGSQHRVRSFGVTV